MRTRIEITGENRPDEVVIYCKEITPETKAIEALLNRRFAEPSGLSFYKGDQQFFLSLREVLFFDTEDNHVYAHTKDSSYEVRMRLYELEAALPRYFVRVSRSSIVSILNVFSIHKNLTGLSLLTFRDTHKEIYCSRMYGKELAMKMNERYLYENS
ncbi:MAG: LytTR family transcriptional regulator [Clostridiaceae bacterium]|nr:LytTR family transcriptional regulator [Clostridiaceae bacterium]